MRRFTTHSHTSNLQGISRLNEYTANQTITSPNVPVRERKEKRQARITGTLEARNKARGSGVARNLGHKPRTVEQHANGWLQASDSETRRNIKKITRPTAKAWGTSNIETNERTLNGAGVTYRNTLWPTQHSNNENSVAMEETTPGENPRTVKTRSRGKEDGAGACEMSPTVSALKKHKSCKGQTSPRPVQYRAGEGGTQAVAEERNLSPRPVWGYEEGGGGAKGRRLGQTEASDNPCGSMCVKRSLTQPTVRRRKATGNKKDGTTVRVGPNKARQTARREHQSVTSISPDL